MHQYNIYLILFIRSLSCNFSLKISKQQNTILFPLTNNLFLFQASSHHEARDLLVGEAAPDRSSWDGSHEAGVQEEEMVPDVQDPPLGQVRCHCWTLTWSP